MKIENRAPPENLFFSFSNLDLCQSLIGLIRRWMLVEVSVVSFGRESKESSITSRSS
jgi:hypothetical protein